VFPERSVEAQASSEASGSGSGLYGKDGKLKNPQKSLYYDPIFNPFGAPPPGMPYREKRECRLDPRCTGKRRRRLTELNTSSDARGDGCTPACCPTTTYNSADSSWYVDFPSIPSPVSDATTHRGIRRR
jgi:hypothetical protein